MKFDKDRISVLEPWKTWVIPYCSLPDNDDAIARIPTYLVEAMGLTADKYDNKFSDILAQEYRDALFRQGHVGCYITLLTVLGDFFVHERNYLIRLQFEYITNHLECFRSWKDASWFESLMQGNHGYNSLVPLMTFWKQIPTDIKTFRFYQYIVPLYLLLGNHTIPPNRLKILRAMYQTLIVSTCHTGCNNYQDVESDLSASRLTFRNIVNETNTLFHMPTRYISYKGLQVPLKYAWKHDDEKATIACAGDWLSFGAYITLVSKYARYSLPISNTKSIFDQEQTYCFEILQSKLFPYNLEGNPNGRNKGNGEELKS